MTMKNERPRRKPAGQRRAAAVVVMAVVVAMVALVAAPTALAAPATSIDGVGIPGFPGDLDALCDDAEFSDADYLIGMTGDLDGCVYGYAIETRFIEQSGMYIETAIEVFVGSWGDLTGSFTMASRFTGKFDPMTGAQENGRCQHPVIAGSGTGDFEGLTGRLDFKDDVKNGVAPYRGRLLIGG